MENYSVFLRAFEPDDYILINQWRNDPKIQRLVAGHKRFVSSEMEKEWVRSKMLNNATDIYLAICTNDENKKMIGYLSINDIDHWNRTACAGGIVIGDKINSNSFAVFEASLLQLEYAFNELNIHRIQGSSLAEHKTSALLALGLLYKYEGSLRDNKFKSGSYHDEFVFSLLEDEYRTAKEQGLYDMKLIMKRVVDLNKKMKADNGSLKKILNEQ